ncbi:FixH family protein [Cytobacillus sp. FJAT-53684]|uniref:FixH family protein n=1 Tax=Cytobacillus mangrovibacter TaxID=3299024 RepID=A0ABW6JYJ0_9BACI
MRKLLFILFLLGTVLFVAACSSESKEEEVAFLEVDLTINPEKAEVNEPVTFEAKVTYGDEKVTDAEDVNFEIWRANDEHHEKVVVEHAEDGIYRLEKSFTEEGTYYIYSHVTAKSMHSMPKKEFIIGQPSEPEEDSSSMDMDENEGEHGSH